MTTYISRLFPAQRPSINLADQIAPCFSSPNPKKDCGVLNAGKPRPLGSGFCDSIYLQQYVFPSIGILHSPVGPSAIAFGVPKVIVNAIKGRTIWSFSHIFKEVKKAVFAEPAVCNRDTSAAVVRVLFMAGLRASVLHLRPNGVKRVSADLSAKPVLSGICYAAFIGEAAARLSVSIRKVCASYHRSVSAIADTFPFVFPRNITKKPQSSKPPVAESGSIDKVWHRSR